MSLAFGRVAVAYDDTQRPDTTGGYCLCALVPETASEHISPARLCALEPAAFDLFLSIDDGLDTPFPGHLHPSAFWAIDTHLDPARALRRARDFDVVFAAQQEGTARLREQGIARCEWLPLACDPEIHQRLPVEKQWDVAFVGHMVSEGRHRFLTRVQQAFPNSSLGPAPHTEMGEIYSRARVVINHALNNDLNMRVFEAMACGALLITPRLHANGQEELFQDRVHLVEYGDEEEALELIRYYLDHPAEREAIAEAGYREVVAHHTYRHRMARVLARMEVFVKEHPVLPGAPTARAVAGPPRDRAYFHSARPELLEMVPAGARRVLDVGCAAGRLGEALKARQACEVVGIELDPAAAAEARTRLDRVIEADVEAADLAELGPFDAIVCGDVLEHLREPGVLLAKLRALLSPEGLLVASLPNVQHLDVLQQLAEGNWRYEAAGLLDRGHLRFFTRRSAEQLFEEAGLELAARRAVPGKGYSEWEQAGRPGQLQAGRLGLSGFSASEAQEFLVVQWLLAGRAAPRTDWGLTSIILLTHNQLAYTQMCLASLRQHTSLPYELIVVDNGSTDGTLQWLQHQEGVHLIANPTNLGFPKGVNQGLRAAQGENLLLLNNDTVLTPGWLRRLLRCLHSGPRVGLVGPFTDATSGPQQIAVPYQSLVGLDGFAWDLGGKGVPYQPMVRLVGFCLLMKREVMEKVGVLDERFGLGTFEDDDLCLRTRRAGYTLLLATDTFVHHFASRTITQVGVDPGELLEANLRKFQEKWGEDSPIPAAARLSAHAPRPPLAPSRPAPPAPAPVPAPAPTAPAIEAAAPRGWQVGRHAKGGLVLEAAGPRLSLCMIVRDEEPRIAACLDSIRPYVDEMVVVDTGSHDRTPELAEARGAKVIRSTWADSFSAARNLSLEHATGDWILWLDADDVMPAESGQMLRALVEKAEPQVLGFVAQVHCPARPGEVGETVVDHVKLFRNRPDLRFELRLHEQILPSIGRAGGEIVRAPLHVQHANYDQSPQGQAKKRERDERLLALDLQEHPEHTFVHFNVGMTAVHGGEFEKAIEHLRQSIALAGPHDSHLRKAYALLASAHRARGDGRAALRDCAEGRARYPDDPELLFNEALTWQLLGDLEAAERALQTLLARGAQSRDYLASVDTGIVAYKALHNLGVVYERKGEKERARGAWQRATEAHPPFLPGWLALGESYYGEGKRPELQALAERARRTQLPAVAVLLEGRAAMLADDAQGAEGRFREALRLDPGFAEACRFLSYVLLQQGERSEVEQVLRRLTELAPEEAEGHRNLGTLYMEQQRFAEAARCYQQALQLRPDDVAVLDLLQEATRRASAPPPRPTGPEGAPPSTPAAEEPR